MVQQPLALDHSASVYLAVTLSPSSIYTSNPINLPQHPSLIDVGHVGELSDVKLLSVPKEDWPTVGDDILRTLLEDKDNIVDISKQEPNARTKRREVDDTGGHDEL